MKLAWFGWGGGAGVEDTVATNQQPEFAAWRPLPKSESNDHMHNTWSTESNVPQILEKGSKHVKNNLF